MDWTTITRNVRRLQVRIVQATKEGRWGKVKALQRLLTHSYSGRVLAVRRVTENNGKKTPGVDQEIWDTPEKKTQAVQALNSRGYQSQPLRRVYIPKSDGKTMRPLGIPTMRDRGLQALYLLALDPVLETMAAQKFLWISSATVLRRCDCESSSNPGVTRLDLDLGTTSTILEDTLSDCCSEPNSS